LKKRASLTPLKGGQLHECLSGLRYSDVSDVSARLNPTVQNAETLSNNKCTGFFPCSNTKRQKKPAVIIRIESKIIDKTLIIVLWPISLFPIRFKWN